MVRKAKKSDLGRALQNKKREAQKDSYNSRNTNAAQVAAATGRHTLNYDERSKLQSVLDATDLEELMLNATMANQEFAADRYAGRFVPQTMVITPLTTDNRQNRRKEQSIRNKLDQTALRIPRRPPWNSNTTYEQLMKQETHEFLEWRRQIATTEEKHSLAATIGGPMMTPFEKNLEVWRQLWRVSERSDVIVQIVDARNPLLYYCEDLYRYVTEEMQKSHLLLLNKADLLSSTTISKWADYFTKRNQQFIFFSAFNASVQETPEDQRVVDAAGLIERLGKFERQVPQTQPNQRLVVGMCGYPNVGKSSTINVLLEYAAMEDEKTEIPDVPESVDPSVLTHPDPSVIEENSVDESTTVTTKREAKQTKRVGVSSTPGKTKHFQTLALTDEILLCDCPGLVFPNFSSSKAELICAGVLSIDTMRGDFLTPVSLLAERIPAALFEGVYGLRFPQGEINKTSGASSSSEKKGYVSAEVLLDTHAQARGFMTDHGQTDRSRSSRLLLKDYVNGRIIYAHAPDGEGESGIGPAVFAKKGKLVYEREEAARELSENSSHLGSTKDSENLLSDVKANDGVNSGIVRARVSGRAKKNGNQEFTRVERNFYPSVE